MKNLKELYVGSNCGIDQMELKDLINLKVNNN